MSENESPVQKDNLVQAIRRSGLGIALFAVLAAAIISITQINTQQRIEQNRAEAAAKALFQIFPRSVDPELFEQRIELSGQPLGYTKAVTAYQAMRENSVLGVILPVRTAEGYSGDIDLLVGVRADGSIQGVRVVSHLETPGLGDNVEIDKSDWILSFNDRKRTGPEDPGWAVKRDGGDFDQFTGATITPRAVVSATAKALNFFTANRDLLLTPISQKANEGDA